MVLQILLFIIPEHLWAPRKQGERKGVGPLVLGNSGRTHRVQHARRRANNRGTLFGTPQKAALNVATVQFKQMPRDSNKEQDPLNM